MADHKRSTQNEGARRRRPAPTIDLSATEVKPEPPAATAEPPKPDTPPSENAAQPAGAPPPTRGSFLRYATLGASLAAGVVATLAVLWFASHLPTGGSSAGAIRDRLAALEAQVHATANAPPAPDSAALRELNQRLGKLEQTLSQAPARQAADPALGERLTALENSVKALGVAVSTLGRRTDDSASTLSAVRDQVDATAKQRKRCKRGSMPSSNRPRRRRTKSRKTAAPTRRPVARLPPMRCAKRRSAARRFRPNSRR